MLNLGVVWSTWDGEGSVLRSMVKAMHRSIVIEPQSTVYIRLSTHPCINSQQTNTIGGDKPSLAPIVSTWQG
ncbi:hypothetical protein ACN38_g5011 [Penicillium nordicum]|uniref:Uncharacterized protein n=1 Tax=Penicillium nordicum TaxID=229535 RepID=A0A0M8P2X1_9EURO|nr:hypothetical protein ACN38_g5011 [Penicillium nordicum]